MVTLELAPRESWTVEDLQRLPDDFRYEVSEGKLVVMAAAMRPWHADVQYRVMHLFRQQGRRAYQEQGVVLGPGEIRTCDVAVFHHQPKAVAYHQPADFALLVEIVSDSSVREDRDIKPGLYAKAGVPEYWRIEQDEDTDEAIVFMYRLAHVRGEALYREARVVALSTLESELG